MRKHALLCAVLFTFTIAHGAEAQLKKLSFDIPSFFTPQPMDDIGIYITSIDEGFADNSTGLAVIWRQSGNLNLGVRVGAADLSDIGQTILLGGEFYGPLGGLFSGGSIDVAWVLGAGAVFGDDYVMATVPAGLSLGLRLGTGSVSIVPYVHPRVTLDVLAVGEGDNEETDTGASFVLDIGAEARLGPRFILRAGGSLIDREAFGAGIAYHWPRPVSVVR